MVAGTIIGASIFVQPSEIARHLGTPTHIMIVWAACGVLTLFGAFVCAELASAMPATGGVYVFMRDTFSPLAGFLWGWAMFWSMHSGIVAAIAMVFARYTAVFAPAGDVGIRVIAVAVILVLSALNFIGVRAGSRVQTAFTVAKVGAVAVLVVVGFLVGSRGAAHASSCSRWWRDSSRTAGGTWSPTRRARQNCLRASFRRHCCGACRS
jgi:APA family basic amino acid/polyamine antiporter